MAQVVPGEVTHAAHAVATVAPFGLPKLSVVFLNLFPPAALPKSSGTATVRIINSGTGNANGTIEVQLLASRDGTVAGAVSVVKTFSLPLRLSPGSYKTKTVTFTYPSGLPAGDYFLVAVVDPTNVIAKASGSTTTVASPAITIAPAFSRLTTSLVLVPVQVQILDSATILVSITNTGNVRATGKASLELLESPVAGLDPRQVLLNTFSNLSLNIAPNSTERFSLTSKIPSGAVAGREFLVTYLSTSLPAGSSVSPVAVPSFATSLFTTSITSVPASVAVGKKGAVSIKLTNASATPATGTVDVSLYQSPTGALGAGATLLQTFTNLVVRISANSSQVLNLSPLIPAGTPIGSSFLIAVLSSSGSLAGNRATNGTIVSLSPTLFTVK